MVHALPFMEAVLRLRAGAEQARTAKLALLKRVSEAHVRQEAKVASPLSSYRAISAKLLRTIAAKLLRTISAISYACFHAQACSTGCPRAAASPLCA